MTRPIFHGLGAALRVLAALLRPVPDPVDVARARRATMRERAEEAELVADVRRFLGIAR